MSRSWRSRLDLAIPAQVFGVYPEYPYRATLCAPQRGPCPRTAGYAVVAQARLQAVARADMAPDLLGYGEHAATSEPITIRVEVEHLRALLGDEPAHVVGHSVGGVIATLRGPVAGRRARRGGQLHPL